MRRILFLCIVPIIVVGFKYTEDDNEVNKLPYALDCSDPYVCFAEDSTPYCTLTGRMVFGHCGLQAAVCVDGEEYDPRGKCLDAKKV